MDRAKQVIKARSPSRAREKLILSQQQVGSSSPKQKWPRGAMIKILVLKAKVSS